MITQQAINKKKEELKQMEEKFKQQNEVGDWYEYKKGWEISTKQQYNGKTYAEILELVKVENIADYQLLQELRNKGLTFLKDFWVFVPNPDKISKDKYVARFDANSNWADLYCDRLPTGRSDSLGVFVVRKKVKMKKPKAQIQNLDKTEQKK
jgi:hypothetical protein